MGRPRTVSGISRGLGPNDSRLKGQRDKIGLRRLDDLDDPSDEDGGGGVLDDGRRCLGLKSVRGLGGRAASRVSSRGQRVLPTAVRDVWNAQVGDRVQLTVVGRNAVLLRRQKEPTGACLYGVLGTHLPDAMRHLSWEDARIRRGLGGNARRTVVSSRPGRRAMTPSFGWAPMWGSASSSG